MISSIQNRQQNTSFGATIVPHEIMKELQAAGKAPTTLSDIASDIFHKTHSQGAGIIMASPEKMAFVAKKKGHNVVPSKQELKSLQNTRLVGYDLVYEGFERIQRIHDEAKPATPKEITALRSKAKPKFKLQNWIKSILKRDR